MPLGGTIEEAASTSGSPYRDLPNAGKFEQALDPSCSCRRKGHSWAEALADAEAQAQRHPGDILVNPELSERMSQPAAEIKASVGAAGATDADLVMVEKTESPTPVLDSAGDCAARARRQALAWKRKKQVLRITASIGARSCSKAPRRRGEAHTDRCASRKLASSRSSIRVGPAPSF
jgi:hypothetical protein